MDYKRATETVDRNDRHRFKTRYPERNLGNPRAFDTTAARQPDSNKCRGHNGRRETCSHFILDIEKAHLFGAQQHRVGVVDHEGRCGVAPREVGFELCDALIQLLHVVLKLQDVRRPAVPRLPRCDPVPRPSHLLGHPRGFFSVP